MASQIVRARNWQTWFVSRSKQDCECVRFEVGLGVRNLVVMITKRNVPPGPIGLFCFFVFLQLSLPFSNPGGSPGKVAESEMSAILSCVRQCFFFL